MRQSTAEIIREYGPFPRANNIGGVTYDGQSVWFAAGDSMRAFDPATGEERAAIDVPAHAGTAFDGEFLYQIAEGRIQKIDPKTRRSCRRFRRPAAAATRGLRGLKARSGWASIARERSIRSIRGPARFSARSSRTASSRV